MIILVKLGAYMFIYILACILCSTCYVKGLEGFICDLSDLKVKIINNFKFIHSIYDYTSSVEY